MSWTLFKSFGPPSNGRLFRVVLIMDVLLRRRLDDSRAHSGSSVMTSEPRREVVILKLASRAYAGGKDHDLKWVLGLVNVRSKRYSGA